MRTYEIIPILWIDRFFQHHGKNWNQFITFLSEFSLFDYHESLSSNLFCFHFDVILQIFPIFIWPDDTMKRFFLIFDNLLIYLYKVEIQKFLWSRRRLQDSQYVSQYYMKSCFKLRFQKLIGLGKNPKKTVQIMIYAVLSPSILSAKSETRIGHLLPPILQSPKYSVMSALMAAWK